MKKFIFITVIFFSLFSFGQVYRTMYYDSLEVRSVQDVNFKKVVYEKNENKFKISTFKKGILSDVRIYSDTTKQNKILEYIEYHSNGNISQIETYSENKTLDLKVFYENGKNKCIYYFDSNGLERKKHLKSYWDKNGKQKVESGNGVFEIEIFPDVILSGSIKNGLQHGVWKSDMNTFPYYIEEYLNGELIKGVKNKSEIDSVVYNIVDIMASPKKGMVEFRKEINSKIKYYGNQKIDGTAIVEFIIDQTGEFKNFKILKSINSEIDNIIIIALENCENWNSSENRGEKLIQVYRLPIKISFNN